MYSHPIRCLFTHRQLHPKRVLHDDTIEPEQRIEIQEIIQQLRDELTEGNVDRNQDDDSTLQPHTTPEGRPTSVPSHIRETANRFAQSVAGAGRIL